jgi:nicotinamide-nucleotide adenylyltransferase
MQNEISPLERFETAGMIARWQPVHRGHLVVLRALAERSRQVRIGIGSSNEYNYRCPFTLPETLDMLRLALGDRQNFSLIPVPDLHNGPRWREMVLQLFGSLDLFVTANPYVRSLLAGDYRLVHPAALLVEQDKIAIEGSMVRREMARAGNWQALVPDEIASYIQDRKLDARFRQEFGLQTLAVDSIIGE